MVIGNWYALDRPGLPDVFPAMLRPMRGVVGRRWLHVEPNSLQVRRMRVVGPAGGGVARGPEADDAATGHPGCELNRPQPCLDELEGLE